MRAQDLEPIIDTLTSEQGPFTLAQQDINGHSQRVLTGLPANLRDYYTLAATHGDKDCLVMDQQRLSFAEVLARVDLFGRVLTNRYGLRAGDRVAIAMRNCPEWCVAFMAVTAIGAVAVPMNSWWESEELGYALQDSGASLIVADAARLARMAGYIERHAIPTIGVKTDDRALPATTTWMADLLLDRDPGPATTAPIAPQDTALIMYTSGSTGKAKGVWSSHQNVMAALGNWLVLVSAVGALNAKQGASAPVHQPGILLAVPLFHVTGLHSLFLLSLSIGRKVVMLHKWDATEALATIEREHITHFNGVPTMSMELMNHPRLSDFDLSSLVEVSAGGAARPADQVATLRQRLPTAWPSTGYGLTETNAMGCIIAQQDYLDRPHCVGKATAPLVQVQIVSPQGAVLPVGERGEICIKSAAVASGYWNQPEATAQAFVDGWFHTGDVGYADEEGYIAIVDRLKDIIIRGGENISCSEVEAALYAHPDVCEAAVFSVPDDRLGEAVGAAVCIKPDASIDTELLQVFVAARLAAYKVPSLLWCTHEPLARTATGKFLKNELRRELLAQAHNGEAGA